ncbi:hypothetical protein JTE90_004982 [Oedothorax gibbosus]|uniref:Uncharacterized protein n=1 Tax=Oedothorax gibbosus TaxID=931172 RepID=A0AAV6VI60_9ARAC|nr:hypothetical protein JTE90_004982 [Oedothorax gibbosus]
MESAIDSKTVEDIMWMEDDDFERAIRDLHLKEILCLMESIQTSMCEEQFQFEQLTLQLQKYPDRNSCNHRKISAALCTVQSLLTNLCTKHMMCSGLMSEIRKNQQASRVAKDMCACLGDATSCVDYKRYGLHS